MTFEMNSHSCVFPFFLFFFLGVFVNPRRDFAVQDAVNDKSIIRSTLSLSSTTSSSISNEECAFLKKLIPPLVLSNGINARDASIGNAAMCFTNIMLPKKRRSTTMLYKILAGLSNAVAASGGTVLQFIEDDKGIVFIASFGVDSSKLVELPQDSALVYGTKVEEVSRELNVRLITGIACGSLYQGTDDSTLFTIRQLANAHIYIYIVLTRRRD